MDKSGQIQEWEVQETPGQATRNLNGTISSLGLKLGPNSRLATYWPSVIFQDDLNQLQETYFTTAAKWLQNPLNVSPQNHSALVEIVYSASSARKGGGNFIYQDGNQKLQAEGRSSSTTALKAGKFIANVTISLSKLTRNRRHSSCCHPFRGSYWGLFRSTKFPGR